MRAGTARFLDDSVSFASLLCFGLSACGSSGADEFEVDLTDLIGNGKSGTVNLSGIDASDTITVNDGGKLSNADEADLTTALSTAVAGVSAANGEATVTFSYSSNKLTLDVDTAVDALNIDNREFDWLV